MLVIPVHSTVQFPNSDAISHQVYSFSSARQFQLPLYRGKPYPPVQFDQPGVVTLGCNIHDNMLAYIVVTAAPFFGRTDADGEWMRAESAGRTLSACASGIRCSTSRAKSSAWSTVRRRARRRRNPAVARHCAPHPSPDGRTHGTTEHTRPRGCRWRMLLCAVRACARGRGLGTALDLRAVSSDGRESFLDNGQGKLRFDEDHQGIQLGRLRAAWNQPLGEVFSAHVEASTWDDDDKNPIDLTEAYLEYRPYPRAGWRIARAARRVLSTHVAREPRASAGKRPTPSRRRPSARGLAKKSAPSASKARSTG